MNFNLYLDRSAAERLDRLAAKTRTPRNAIIRRAVHAWLDKEVPTWPKEVLEYRGTSSVPPFESHRGELREPVQDPFGGRAQHESGRRPRSKR